jgi:hypothetical protein
MYEFDLEDVDLLQTVCDYYAYNADNTFVRVSFDTKKEDFTFGHAFGTHHAHQKYCDRIEITVQEIGKEIRELNIDETETKKIFSDREYKMLEYYCQKESEIV